MEEESQFVTLKNKMMKSGFALIDKSINISSQKIDSILKKKYNLNKVGHLGTLDPLASGLLVVGINSATRYFKYFENLSKKYILTLRLGATSKTLDREAELENVIDVDYRGKENIIDEYLKSSIKKYLQTPPIYSAIKVSGTPLYKYAIKNKEVEIKKREVEIYDIKRLSDIRYIDNQSFVDIYLYVSKGFYVRSFAKEIGEYLSIPTLADDIRRIQVGPFKIEDSKKLDDDLILINPLDYLCFNSIDIDNDLYKSVLNGQRLSSDLINFSNEFIILKYKNEPIAIYKKDNEKDNYKLDLLIKNENLIY